jgi:hypothetical protein
LGIGPFSLWPSEHDPMQASDPNLVIGLLIFYAQRVQAHAAACVAFLEVVAFFRHEV